MFNKYNLLSVNRLVIISHLPHNVGVGIQQHTVPEVNRKCSVPSNAPARNDCYSDRADQILLISVEAVASGGSANLPERREWKDRAGRGLSSGEMVMGDNVRLSWWPVSLSVPVRSLTKGQGSSMVTRTWASLSAACGWSCARVATQPALTSVFCRAHVTS